MIDHRLIAKRVLPCLLLIFVISFANITTAQNAQHGEVLFKANCASCHSLTKVVVGPALAGVEERWPSHELLHLWIKNWGRAVATGNAYAVKIKDFSPSAMNVFDNLSDADIEDIIAYTNKPVVTPPTDKPTGDGTTSAKEDDNSLLYGILTLILAVIALVLLQVNSNLRKLADDAEGVPATEPIPFYRNKAYITFFTLILCIIAGYFLTRWAIGLGRQVNYEPVQPIYYSHKVHAGTNQINCLYCHGGAFEGKQANIPSVNICMNCHMTINEYAGAKLYREDGSEVNATGEIQKIYEAAGWDPSQRKYTNAGKPIAWIRIHNLPDHVYFNHSQHTRAGKVQCQTCHGEINTMDEVYQFSELSMGWCINCHRETKVDFNDEKGNGNKFYSLYEKYHNEIKAKKRDSVTVSDIGGTECQKCHY